MKENVSGYSRNPCSLNRERDAAFAAKLLTLPTGFFSAEKSEEWMARSPVWPDDVIASETASRHQPMNWRDSIWAQTRSRGRRSRCVKLATQRLVPYSENKGYASNPRRFRPFENGDLRKCWIHHFSLKTPGLRFSVNGDWKRWHGLVLPHWKCPSIVPEAQNYHIWKKFIVHK